jgi:hypothetical protein
MNGDLLIQIAGVLLVTGTASLVVVSWPHEYPLYLLFAAVAIALTGGTGVLGVGIGIGVAVAIRGMRQLSAVPLATEKIPDAGPSAG